MSIDKDNQTHQLGLPRIKFHERHKEQILNGIKRATLRYNSTLLPDVGEPFVLELENGDYLGTAICVERGYESVEWLLKEPVLGHREYASFADFKREFESYYPDVEFSEETCLEIVYWGDLIGRKIQWKYE